MRNLLLIALIFTVSASWAGQDPVAIKTDRYTLAVMDPTPSSVNPLYTTVTAAFATDVITIGEAIDEVLDGTGYRVRRNADQTHQGIYLDSILLNQPLPAAHRELGPLPLIEILQVIAGSSWTVKGSDLSRTVTFILNDAAAPSGGLLDILIDEVDGLAYTMRSSTEVVEPQRMTVGQFEPNAAIGGSAKRAHVGTQDQPVVKSNPGDYSQHSVAPRKVTTATTSEVAPVSPGGGSARSEAPDSTLSLLKGESLVSAIMKLQSRFRLDSVVYSVDDESIDLNRLYIGDDIDVSETQIRKEVIELNDMLSGFIISDKGKKALIITDNPALSTANTAVFVVKPGSVQSNAKRLLSEFGWHMPFKDGWQAQDYPITSSFPIAISREDPRQAFSELLAEYPIQARLNPSTESVHFVNRNPTH